MMQCFASHQNKLPAHNLPYNFKKHISELASLTVVKNLRQTCPEFNELCSHRPDIYDQLYITDDANVFKWASRRRYIFIIFKYIYFAFKFFLDGLDSFHPIWQSVVHLDDVVKNNRPIFVTDTLIVNCQSIEAFDKLIPYICGSFTRLAIHGEFIKPNQLQKLMQANVLMVKITAKLQLKPVQYSHIIRLIMQHLRGFHTKFAFHGENVFPSQLRDHIYTAFANHPTHVLISKRNFKHKWHSCIFMFLYCTFTFIWVPVFMTPPHTGNALLQYLVIIPAYLLPVIIGCIIALFAGKSKP